MEAFLNANPEKGSIQAVWAAWDDPALGAEQAIIDAGRQNEGIIIVGIDATEQARDRIAMGGNFKATVAQDFKGIASKVVETVEGYLEIKDLFTQKRLCFSKTSYFWKFKVIPKASFIRRLSFMSSKSLNFLY